MSSTFSCALCDVHCPTRQQLQAHEAGKRHIANCFRFSVCNGISVVGQDCSSIPEPKKLTPDKSSLSPFKMSRQVHPGASLRSDSIGDHEVNSPESKTLGSVGSNYCEFCNVRLNSSDQLREHLAGQKHMKKVKSSSSASLQNHVATLTSLPERSPRTNITVAPDLLGTCMDAKHDSALDLTKSRDNASPVNSPVVCLRTFVANCRQYLGPIWPGVTFLQHEADTLVFASELSTDCVLRLEDQNDGWFRIGIHLVTALLTANREASSDPTSAIWICSKTEVGPDRGLFRSFRFPPTSQRSIQCPTLRVVQLPCVNSNLLEYDLIITDADQFCSQLSETVLKRNQVCCIIIQDAGVLASHFGLCTALQQYMQSAPLGERGRIICFSSAPLPGGCLFNAFRLVHFSPICTLTNENLTASDKCMNQLDWPSCSKGIIQKTVDNLSNDRVVTSLKDQTMIAALTSPNFDEDVKLSVPNSESERVYRFLSRTSTREKALHKLVQDNEKREFDNTDTAYLSGIES
ncbi:zinc finger, C2H2 type, partial [Opisthorchis viverrini]